MDLLRRIYKILKAALPWVTAIAIALSLYSCATPTPQIIDKQGFVITATPGPSLMQRLTDMDCRYVNETHEVLRCVDDTYKVACYYAASQWFCVSYGN